MKDFDELLHELPELSDVPTLTEKEQKAVLARSMEKIKQTPKKAVRLRAVYRWGTVAAVLVIVLSLFVLKTIKRPMTEDAAPITAGFKAEDGGTAEETDMAAAITEESAEVKMNAPQAAKDSAVEAQESTVEVEESAEAAQDGAAYEEAEVYDSVFARSAMGNTEPETVLTDNEQWYCTVKNGVYQTVDRQTGKTVALSDFFTTQDAYRQATDGKTVIGFYVRGDGELILVTDTGELALGKPVQGKIQ